MKIDIWNEMSDGEKQAFIMRQGNEDSYNVKDAVADIINGVRLGGDDALRNYTKTFDGADLENFLTTEEELAKSEFIDNKYKIAIKKAYENIWNFHELQFPQAISLDNNGIKLSREYRAIEVVGIYIPGGTAPLVSTLLMLAIPAKIAGCKKIIMMTPPNKEGEINPAILYAAQICGIKEIYKIGGAQAIAAMAFGTETIQKVYKICGPGNKYVTEAKQQVSMLPEGASIDMPAGPSEVLVIADDSADPSFVASDLLAQAEHDVVARAVLVTTSRSFAEKVKQEVGIQKNNLSRKAILDQSLDLGQIIIASNLEDCFEIANLYAPEHLILQVENTSSCKQLVQNAGSVFIGPWSSEALGDYASGPNHVLPTYGYARNYSGLCVESFMKSISFQEVTEDGLLDLAPIVEDLAELEGLDGHKNSVTIRRTSLERKYELVRKVN